MGDESKVDEAAEDVSAVTVESEVAVDAPDASADKASSLRLAGKEASSPDDLLGVEADVDSSDADGKRGLAALFGAAKSVEGETGDDAPKWAIPGGRAKREGSGIRLVNRVLGVAVVLMLFVGVLDLFATIRQAPGELTLIENAVVPTDPLISDAPTGGGALPVLSNLLESFAQRPIVQNLDRGPVQTTVQVTQVRTQAPDWKVRAQKLNLIGLSATARGDQEAIVSDQDSGRMYILRVGQEVMVGDNQFKLVRIATDHVVFEKDGDDVTVK